MSKYSEIKSEHQLRNLVFDDYFKNTGFTWEQEINNIDFIITDGKLNTLFIEAAGNASIHHFWAENKLDETDVYEMLTQLILTCKKTYDNGEYLAPAHIGCFDRTHIAFVDFSIILPIFTEADINWNQTPSDHKSDDFKKAYRRITELIDGNIVIFNFGLDDIEIHEFIKTHIGIMESSGIKILINKNNFQQIFYKWATMVKPKIDVSSEEWMRYKHNGILECDFFLADMMSENGNSLESIQELKILLKNNRFKFRSQNEFGRLSFATIGFTDEGNVHTIFWNRYKRPPIDQAQTYIINRRDLLVSQNIREMRGSFFTPTIWVKKSQEYLAKTFGKNWQDEYYIWDCAAGTGNLLAGLTNKYNIWASDIDNANVERMNAISAMNDELKLLPSHVFQFDFLNDDFSKLPEELKKIIDDPEKRKKLIIYINPPYAEADNRQGMGRTNVATSKIKDQYASYLGYTKRELYIQFFVRIYFEIPDCKLAEFSTIKIICAPRFIDFRNFFKATLKKCFMVPANSFDNVTGKFPIGFMIWDTNKKKTILNVTANVFNEKNRLIGQKIIFTYDNVKLINDWVKTFRESILPSIATIIGVGSDFQNQRLVRIEKAYMKVPADNHHWQITKDNTIESTIYLAVRHCIAPNWINNRDLFLYPNNDWKKDINFQNNCLVLSLFHTQNHISTFDTTNHWIPFTEKQVDAKEKFESHFMIDFLKNKTLSPEAQSVYNAGLELWKYYHSKTKHIKTASVNASFYDIRDFFQGRNDKGKMNPKSEDGIYNSLISKLRDAMNELTVKIQPKVYEYGFLKK